jgi:glutamate-5-semialdehyde dehydrogenase
MHANPSVLALAQRARHAQQALARASTEQRSDAMHRAARLLDDRRAAIFDANAADVAEAERSSVPAPLVARLRLSSSKLATLIEGLTTLANGPDPVGQTRMHTWLDDDLELRQITSPLGVLLVVFESRPDAVVQIGGLAIRSANGVILKGGREATRSNASLVACLRDALASVGLAGDAVGHVQEREQVQELLGLHDHIDLVIPRGSGDLVRSIQASTRIPVLGHAEGICMLYLDRAADPQMAIHVAVDGKCDYPAACNATETLLVHRDFLPHLGAVGAALQEQGVEIRADAQARAWLPGAAAAAEGDGTTEYGDLILAVRTVASLEEAMAYVHAHGSGHTDAIVTEDAEAAERFLREVDSSSVLHNASTRFADGYRYGLGAEVGISTSRIHARGPVGVEGLLTTRYQIRGKGQGAGDYGPGKRTFVHRRVT